MQICKGCNQAFKKAFNDGYGKRYCSKSCYARHSKYKRRKESFQLLNQARLDAGLEPLSYDYCLRESLI